MKHMLNSNPNIVQKDVTWETMGREASVANVISSGNKVGGQPHVSVCMDRSEENCKRCILELSCCVSLSPERV